MGLKISNFNIVLGFQKNEYFWGHEEVVDIVLGSYIIGLFLEGGRGGGGGGGGTLIFSSYVDSGPASTLHPKKIS